jgi:hypothetical protein
VEHIAIFRIEKKNTQKQAASRAFPSHMALHPRKLVVSALRTSDPKY